MNYNDEEVLHRTCQTNNVEIINLIISTHKDININLQDKYGYTALHYAYFNKNNVEIIKLLLKYKDININLQNNKGIHY